MPRRRCRAFNANMCHAMQEKRYRSMQEHIRRAHPEHYISKLPATEESFLLMINTPPSERPQPQPGSVANNSSPNHQSKPYVPDRNAYYRDDYSNPGTPRPYEEYPHGLLPAAANAAAALTSLHNYKSRGPDWDGEGVSALRIPCLVSFWPCLTGELTCTRRTPFRILRGKGGLDPLLSYLLYSSTTRT